MRTIADIPEDDLAELDKISRKANISRAELLRRLIADYLQRQVEVTDDEAFGIWQHRGIDGRSHEDQLRDEWGT